MKFPLNGHQQQPPDDRLGCHQFSSTLACQSETNQFQFPHEACPELNRCLLRAPSCEQRVAYCRRGVILLLQPTRTYNVRHISPFFPLSFARLSSLLAAPACRNSGKHHPALSTAPHRVRTSVYGRSDDRARVVRRSPALHPSLSPTTSKNPESQLQTPRYF